MEKGVIVEKEWFVPFYRFYRRAGVERVCWFYRSVGRGVEIRIDKDR